MTRRGNVLLLFPEEHLTVHADELIIDRNSRDIRLSGDVRITLEDYVLPK
jgi:hypothetical protein